MTFLPLVQRELQAASRRKSTFRLRSWTAAIAFGVSFAALLFLWIFMSGTNPGGPVFTIVSSYVFGLALLAGPFLAADCISQEKREGTLGLLCLTDLRAYDIILGKFVAVSLNAFYGWLSLLPILALSLLVGGISNAEFWRTALALGNTLFVSLAAGVFVSTVSRESQKAIGQTLVLLLILTGLFPLLADLKPYPIILSLSWISPFSAFTTAREAAYSAAPSAYWTSLSCSHLVAWLFLALSIRFLSQCWIAGGGEKQTRPASSKTKTESVRRRRKQYLEVNPVLWFLADFRSTRSLTWGIVIVWGTFLLIACLISTRDVVWIYGCAKACGFVLKILVAIEACRFFTETRQSGLFEIFLCTPLRDQDIIKGQWLALQRVFLWPLIAFLLITFFVPALIAFWSNLSQLVPFVFGLLAGCFAFIWFAIGFAADTFAVIWFGMWLALTVKRPQRAPALTVLSVLILPMAAFCAEKLVDIFFILWGAIKLHQDLRWTVAQQYQRPITRPVPAVASPPVAARHG